MTSGLARRTRDTAHPDSEILARVSDLRVRFPGAAGRAVDGISFDVRRGECVALVGESGSGKSLTARALLGLLPEAAIVTGTVEVATPGRGRVVAPAPGAAGWQALRGAVIGLIPQDALGSLDPLRRLVHEVGDPLRLHGRASRAERPARVRHALAAAGMPDPERHLRQRPYELSGGQRQRALLAAAVIADPQLLIADEPTTALDAGHRSRIFAELRRRADAGSGVLLVSHDLASVRGIADRVLVIRDGRVLETGTPESVFTRPAHDFTRELVAASPAGVPRGTRLRARTRMLTRVTPPPHVAEHETSPPRMPAVLALDGVSVAFGARTVLRGASLEVRPGETVGLVGESGAGKTTLLRIALGLQAPTTGDVRIDGVDRANATRSARRAMRRRLGYVPQDPLDSFPRHTSGARILSDALRAAQTPRHERPAQIARLADEVQLTRAQLGRPTETLSGGQRQRLAIARALAGNPGVILLDEPVSALDATVQARILDLLDDLQEHHGTAFLLVSHDDDVIQHMSDRVLHISTAE